jgi:hypothetical protein
MTETEGANAPIGQTQVRPAGDFDSVYRQGVPPGISAGVQTRTILSIASRAR